MDSHDLQSALEALILAVDKPLSIDRMQQVFGEADAAPSREEIRHALEAIEARCKGRGFELKQVASGYRFQVCQSQAHWVSKLWQEKPARYSRALLETLSIIAYRQPITRGDIEEIRGVAVSSNIVRTLLEREWVRIVGHRDVPGKPALYATTREFLDYFNLKKLDELPPLREIRDLINVNPELALGDTDSPPIQDAVQTDEHTQPNETLQ